MAQKIRPPSESVVPAAARDRYPQERLPREIGGVNDLVDVRGDGGHVCIMFQKWAQDKAGPGQRPVCLRRAVVVV
ncbi:MAG: hypothetical protein ACREH8_24230 [Opitutaceae bacterium]